MKQLILASQSPRRSEILAKAGYQFVSFPVHVSEIPNQNLNLNEQIIDIARRKSIACMNDNFLHKNISITGLKSGCDPLILSADTLVCLDEKPIGKPENKEQAFQILTQLSGRSHQVKTAVYLIDVATQVTVFHLETTEVFFKTLNPMQIHSYIATGEPMDKAGAYGIQGLGGQFVEKFIGDFDNVVGLPLHALENLFKINKWNILRLQPDHSF